MRAAPLAFAAHLALAAPATAQVEVEVAFPNLTFSAPVGIEYANDGSDRLYVVEQGGRIRVFLNDSSTASAPVFLDITDRVTSGGEAGLLGLAFHPNYAENGHFYVNYTRWEGANGRSFISRFTRSPFNPNVADPSSEVILLEVGQPFGNHNGGDVAFGPDGYLYLALGDGGSGGDPEENGQDTGVLLGKILRLDVDGGGSAPDCGGASAPYTVPPNALADGPGGACDEVFAFGLRNPWRFSFDRETGDFWVADVGQNAWEEVNVVTDGGNYGWDVKEGPNCFEAPDPGEPACDDPSLIDPVWWYGHALGCSITGGFVYRGAGAPELAGRYVYGDYCSGRIWALTYDGASTVENEQLEVGTFSGLLTFGEDAAGELYFARSNGQVYRFTSGSVGAEPPAPTRRLHLGVAGPNPFRARTAVTVGVARTGPARLVAYDVLGREAAVLFEGVLAAGERRRVEVDGAALAAGAYVLRLEAWGATASQRLIRAR